MEIHDLLVADLEHFGEALLRNEEIGEKRFEFFVTLATAVIGGLVAFATNSSPFATAYLTQVLRWSLVGLLLFGLLTYLRMLQRNRVTDEYKRTLNYIRTVYKSAAGEALLPTYSVPRTIHSRATEWLRAGYGETLAVLNGLLTIGLLLAWQRTPLIAAGLGLALGAVLWKMAGSRGRHVTQRPDVYFRAGVGAIIVDDHGLVLAIERKDNHGAWQCPQGGIEDGETPLVAVLREISEETGIASDDLERIAEYPTPLAYLLPPEAQSLKTGLGQVQFWFLFKCRDSGALSLGKEARGSSWRPFDEIAVNVVMFRRPVYEQLRQFVHSHGAA
jgi:putative (di)nucleoside polyphosphate hydrolase